MPDTGLPWEIPYLDGTELVRDYPAASEALAVATAAGLSAAGGLVAVKHALFTGTQSASVAGSANVAVTNLSITHTLAAATNKLIISTYLGVVGTTAGSGQVGLAVADGGTLIGIGGADGIRTRVGAGARVAQNAGNEIVSMPSLTFVYEPGDTAAHTFDVRAINVQSVTRTLYINRNERDDNNAFNPRASSGFVIQEVKV
jgi:hypothetical protein